MASLIVIFWIIGFTYFGCKMAKNGNAWGILLAFLGLSIIGLIISIIVFFQYNKTNNPLTIIVNNTINDKNQEQEFYNKMRFKILDLAIEEDFENAKRNIQVLKNLSETNYLKFVEQDIQKLILKTTDTNLLNEYSRLLTFLKN
ncbi:hypothetical protein [Spiroplasma endosymbiont of Crioceris asparagi]|uniref:hypothetical protein n=1 Tax=Spiroplasma endosymbiont of Crioceris asparagi TaxID=3066286 RepID=UPI0030CA88E9